MELWKSFTSRFFLFFYLYIYLFIWKLVLLVISRNVKNLPLWWWTSLVHFLTFYFKIITDLEEVAKGREREILPILYPLSPSGYILRDYDIHSKPRKLTLVRSVCTDLCHLISRRSCNIDSVAIKIQNDFYHKYHLSPAISFVVRSIPELCQHLSQFPLYNFAILRMSCNLNIKVRNFKNSF